MQSTENITKYGKGKDHFVQPNCVGCQVKFPVGCIHALPEGKCGARQLPQSEDTSPADRHGTNK